MVQVHQLLLVGLQVLSRHLLLVDPLVHLVHLFLPVLMVHARQDFLDFLVILSDRGFLSGLMILLPLQDREVHGVLEDLAYLAHPVHHKNQVPVGHVGLSHLFLL